MTASGHTTISLLYPLGSRAPNEPRGALNEADLGLTTVVRALDVDGRHARFISAVLTELNTDPHVIRYRQDVLEDLLHIPNLLDGCAAQLARLGALSVQRQTWGEKIPLLQVAARLAELDNYMTCVEGLWSTLASAGDALSAEGLLALRDALASARAHPQYQALAEELPQLRARLDQAGSVTLGINLDPQLRPESATVVSINHERFAGKTTLLRRLFGQQADADVVRGITALYKAEEGQGHTPEHDLFRDLDRLLERVAAPVGEAIARYTHLNSNWLRALEPELAFYLGAARLVGDLCAAGLALCRPEIAPLEERSCQIVGMYSFDLALRLRAAQGAAGLATLVPNDVTFGQEVRVFILTGPNSGGKTTYIRALGQTQALCQAGLLIPGQRARISPVDGIFTHFPAPERLDAGGGRLAEELERMAQIFRSATRYSLVLLNEPLASTDQASARLLSRDILGGLKLLGARTIFVTHLYELADDAATDGAQSNGGVVTLVAEVAPRDGNGAEPAPTFTIAPGRPQAAAYAAELARQHGLSLSQIARILNDRGLTPRKEL